MAKPTNVLLYLQVPEVDKWPISSGSSGKANKCTTQYLEVPEVNKWPISSGSSGKANKRTAQYLEVHIKWSTGGPSVQGLVAQPTVNA